MMKAKLMVRENAERAVAGVRPALAATCLVAGFRVLRGSGLMEPLLHAAAERVDQDRLAGGAVGFVMAVHPAAPWRFSQRDPVGRAQAVRPQPRRCHRVWFYGPQPSPARQNLDLLVEWEPGRDLLDHARLVQYLEALHF
jgi:hypothetical protein